MKANELRIGNCCEYLLEDKFDNPDNLWSLNVIDAEDILYLSEYPDCKLYQPIPLTPEVLEKCGFDTTDPVLAINSDGDRLYLSDTKIEYLHQFQNAIFALTGEELTYIP